MTENLNLEKVLFSETSPPEVRLPNEMGSLRNIMGKDQVKVRFLQSDMLADDMTKDAARGQKLLNV